MSDINISIIENVQNILVEVQENGSGINLTAQETNQSVNLVIGPNIGIQGEKGDKGDSGELKQTFEVISQNILDWEKTFYYDYLNGGTLTQIDYSLSGQNIYKKFTYSGDNLILCSLSGNLLSGTNINKSFLYNLSGDLDSITYSF
jgi:hypothetical protein